MSGCIRVLHMVDNLEAGGIQSFLINLYRNIDREKVQFDFLIYNTDGKSEFYKDDIIKLGGKVLYCENEKGLKKINEIKKKYKLLKESNYDIIHIHGERPKNFLEAYAAKKAKKKTIIMHSHNDRIDRDKKLYLVFLLMQNLMKHFCEKLATDYFACSKSAANWMYSKKLINSGKVKIINNGIDSEKYVFNKNIRDDYRRRLNIYDKFIVGHVGRISYQKNHEFLIDIFSKLHKKESDSILILIGVGDLEEKIKEKVREKGLDNHVKFLGLRSDVNMLLQAIDVFCFPSHFEGLPLTLVEAQAASLPCIVSSNITNEVKLTELINFVSLDEKAEIWADKILKYKDNNLRKNRVIEIRNGGFDMKEVGKRLQEFYLNK